MEKGQEPFENQEYECLKGQIHYLFKHFGVGDGAKMPTTSQLNYCPLTWMFHSRKLNNKINRLHERCLRLIYSDRGSSYEELLDKDNSVPIHQKNLQKLAIEMFKTYTGMTPQIMNEVFPRNYTLNYNLRRHPEFASKAINTVHYGSESLSILEPAGKCWLLI